MHGLQACLFKYITVAAFHIMLMKMPLKGEDGGHAFNSRENYINLIMENHGKGICN